MTFPHEPDDLKADEWPVRWRDAVVVLFAIPALVGVCWFGIQWAVWLLFR